MKKVVYSILAVSLLMSTPVMAGTKAGDMELGISVSLNYTDPDEGQDDTNVFANGSINRFFTDAFSVGVAVDTFLDLPEEGDDSTAIGLYLEPNYHLNTKGDVIPYFGGHAGMYSFESGGADGETEFSYGGQAGAKAFISENVALKLEGRYTGYDGASIYGAFFGLSVFF
jgi:opacity protein-like surface antigen